MQTAIANGLKSAGVDTNAALLYNIAVECLKRNGTDPRKAVGSFADEVRDAGGILITLMGDRLSYEIVRNAALDYLEIVARDMAPKVLRDERSGDAQRLRGSKAQAHSGVPEESEDELIQIRRDSQQSFGLSSSPIVRNAKVHNSFGGDQIVQQCHGRVVPIHNKPRINLAELKVANAMTATIFDTMKVRGASGDRGIGNLEFREIDAIIEADQRESVLLRREAILLDMIRKHAIPHAPSALIREAIKLEDLQRMAQKAAELSNAE